MHSAGWPQKIAEMEQKVAAKELQRDAVQKMADSAMAEMNSKLFVFKDPYMAMGDQTESLLNELKQSTAKLGE